MPQRPSLIQPFWDESGGRLLLPPLGIGWHSGQLGRTALLTLHVISPALAAAGEVYSMGLSSHSKHFRRPELFPQNSEGFTQLEPVAGGFREEEACPEWLPGRH